MNYSNHNDTTTIHNYHPGNFRRINSAPFLESLHRNDCRLPTRVRTLSGTRGHKDHDDGTKKVLRTLMNKFSDRHVMHAGEKMACQVVASRSSKPNSYGRSSQYRLNITSLRYHPIYYHHIIIISSSYHHHISSYINTGRWFGTCFIFPHIGNNDPN